MANDAQKMRRADLQDATYFLMGSLAWCFLKKLKNLSRQASFIPRRMLLTLFPPSFVQTP